MTTEKLPVKYQSKVDEIIDLLNGAMEAWVKAGRIVAEIADEDEKALEAIAENVPLLTIGVLRKLEKLGRGQLLPELLVPTRPGLARLAKMPIDVQRRYLHQPVPLLVQGPSGMDELLVRVADLQGHQLDQVFDVDGVRDLGAQRAKLESRKPSPLHVEPGTCPYSVKDKTLRVTHPCELSLKELTVIVAQMAGR